MFPVFHVYFFVGRDQRIIVFSDEFLIKSDIRNSLTNDVNAACVALKNTKYSPNIKLLSSATQKKKSY